MEKTIIIEPIKNSGLVIAEPSPENYHSKLFGKVGAPYTGTISPIEPPVIFEDGKGWLDVWNTYDIQEIQFNLNFDTFSCVIYTIAKALCLYLYKVYNIKVTVSEMYNAFYAGVISGRGTTIEKGMNSFYYHGWVDDAVYLFTPQTTEAQYRSRPPIKIQLMAEGKLTVWNFHWNVIPKTLEAIKIAYKRTPVVLTGFAWAAYLGEGVYYDYNNPANHAFLGMEINDKGNNLISDTYRKDFAYVEQSQINAGDLIKELDKSFNYGSAHTVWLTPGNTKPSLLTNLTNMIKKIYRTIHGTLRFVKPIDDQGNLGKQELTTVQDVVGFLADEFGIDPKHNNLSEEYLNAIPDHKFFGK